VTYRLLGFAPDPEPLADFDDLAEAVDRCERLVREAGYRCAELWDDAGAVVFRAGYRPGTFGRSTPGELASRATSRARGAGAARPSDRELPIPVVRDDDRRRAAAGGAPAPAPLAVAPESPATLAALALASLAASALAAQTDGGAPRPPAAAARDGRPLAPRSA
jgi:hypothetical protein